MDKEEIMDAIFDIQRKIDKMGFKGQNEYDLLVRDEIADWIISLTKWQNVNFSMPQSHKYVLIHTPYCKYKCSVGFWNGVEWKSADNGDIISNVELWQELPIVED